MKMPSAAWRKWMYRVGNAVVGVLVVYGLVNGVEAAAFGLLLNALLGMADVKTVDVPPVARHIQHEEIL